MNDSPKPLDDDKSFIVRLKEEKNMTLEEFENEKKGINHTLAKDSRGRILKLAPVRGEKMRNDKSNLDYPIVARVQQGEDDEVEILNIISEPVEFNKKTQVKDTAENSK